MRRKSQSPSYLWDGQLTDNVGESFRPWQDPQDSQDPEPWAGITSHGQHPETALTSSQRCLLEECPAESEFVEFNFYSSRLEEAYLSESDLDECNSIKSGVMSPDKELGHSELWHKLWLSCGFRQWLETWRRSDCLLGDAQEGVFHEELSAPRQSTDHFKYDALDLHQSSIRLVHILPDLSADNLLQCRIFHSTTDSTFVCLSYVWSYCSSVHSNSNVEANVAILMNGLTYHVRPNLFSFLRMARSNGIGTRRQKFDLSTPIWIDALCIDQSNTSERLHQVAQMGEIYSKANAVHAWLGNHSSYATYEETGGTKETKRQKAPESRIMTCGADVGFNSIRKDFDDLGQSMIKFVFTNPYWRRAWVVQEVFLARKLTIWLLSEPLDREELREIASQILDSRTSMQEDMIMDGTYYLDFHFSNFKQNEKADLVDLLDQYADKQCADPRDRIYSLLALCTEQSKVGVDYSIELQDLAYLVLQRHPGKLCLCVAAIVAQTLWSDSTTSDISCGLEEGPWVEFHVSHKRVETHPDNGCDLASLELKSICDCFHRGVYPVPMQSQNMISAGQHGKTWIVKLGLRLLPIILPHRIVKCSALDQMSATANVRVGWGAGRPPPHLLNHLPVISNPKKDMFRVSRLLDSMDRIFSKMDQARK